LNCIPHEILCNLQSRSFICEDFIAKFTSYDCGMHGAPSAAKGVHMDALYLGITIVFFALSWGLIVLCERL